MSYIINASHYIFGSSKRGTGKKWAKKITEVDMSKTNGYAFIGDWLPREGECRLQKGDIILSTGWIGSNKYPENIFRIYEVEEGELKLLQEGNYKNLETLKEIIRELVQKEDKPSVVQLLDSIKQKIKNDSDLKLLIHQLEQELDENYDIR